jgi:hypothetical protein
MTEREWLEGTDPKQMLRYLRDKASDRRFRLAAIACCRRIWHWMTDERSRAAVEFAERYADVGVARRKGRPGIVKAASAACQEAETEAQRTKDGLRYASCMIRVNATHAATTTLEGRAWLAADWASGFSANATGWDRRIHSDPETLPAWDPSANRPEQEQQAHLLRDIFGNPFRPATLDPICLTPTVQSLATAIYEQPALPEGTLDPARLAILADALEDAGCDNGEVLGHCRSPGPHVRGCWLIDLILARE